MAGVDITFDKEHSCLCVSLKGSWEYLTKEMIPRRSIKVLFPQTKSTDCATPLKDSHCWVPPTIHVVESGCE